MTNRRTPDRPHTRRRDDARQQPPTNPACALRTHVDPRLPRVSAASAAATLALALVTVGSVRPLALGLLASQVATYGFAGFVNLHWSAWAQLFLRVIRSRSAAPTQLEDARPHRFAQLLGFLLTAAGLAAFAVGPDAAGYAATALALTAAALHAGLGICPACSAYRLARRLPPASA